MFSNSKVIENWSAPQSKVVRSIDPTTFIVKPVVKENRYMRSNKWRKRKSIPITGTNSECY
jgi:hypothetical protein